MNKTEKLLKLLFLIAFATISQYLSAQQWGEYTLYSVQNSNTAYLIDTNGNTYHSWTFATTAKTGYSSYLMPGGTLVRTVSNSGNSLSGGGMTGRVQKVDYNGNVLWDWTYSSATYCLHHDICPLPNGNVLMICYDVKTSADVTAAGCSTTLSAGMWSEKIIEVQPTGATTGTIVWEWKLWDHLCQNYNSAKNNYVTSIVQNPQLVNINYLTSKDWVHMNGIDYNATLNQIVVSSHYLNELWIIDHSTTTAEAATHTGGNSGKGGDLLYRWGNPLAYGATGTKNFNVVHDAHWIPYNCPKGGYLSGFNNLGGTNSKSAVDIVNPPLNGYNYNINLGSAYTPATYNWRHNSASSTTNEGNSQHLPNGNVLVCIAKSGYFYEIDSNQNILWSKTVSGTVSQVFRYSKDYVLGTLSVNVSANKLNVCMGDSVTLNATPSIPGSYNYSWSSVPAGFTSNLQYPKVSPTTNTTYSVSISDGNNTANSSVNITVNPIPATPVITVNSNILSSTVAYSYQWYLNNVLIQGANSQNYVPLQNGNYQVQITDVNSCISALSVPFNFTGTAISEFSVKNKIYVYPNPSNGQLFINNPDAVNEYNVIVSDTYGKIISDNKNGKIIDISNMKNGMYFIKIYSENKILYSNKISLIK